MLLYPSFFPSLSLRISYYSQYLSFYYYCSSPYKFKKDNPHGNGTQSSPDDALSSIDEPTTFDGAGEGNLQGKNDYNNVKIATIFPPPQAETEYNIDIKFSTINFLIRKYIMEKETLKHLLFNNMLCVHMYPVTVL